MSKPQAAQTSGTGGERGAPASLNHLSTTSQPPLNHPSQPQGGKFDLAQDLCQKCLKYNKSCSKARPQP